MREKIGPESHPRTTNQGPSQGTHCSLQKTLVATNRNGSSSKPQTIS